MFKLKSGRLMDELRRRAEQMARDNIKLKLTVPPEHIWWYYQEFGTATFNENAPGSKYRIPGEENVGAKTLHFYWERLGEVVHFEYVWHPGVHPKHMITDIEKELRSTLADSVKEALAEGKFSYEVLRGQLTQVGMARVKELIVQAFDQKLGGGPR